MKVQAAEIRQLFDEKAPSWNARYLPGGSLVGRVARFQEVAERLRPAPADLLDFGCGTGNISRALAKSGYRVSACDASPEMVSRARHPSIAMLTPVRWYEVSVDVPDLPFDDASFDVVVASSVLEYVVDPLGSLHEIRRILRSTGTLICTVPNPAHRVRRIEALIRPLAIQPIVKLVSRVSSKATSHLRYLRVSHNRLDVVGWGELARMAGFVGGVSQVGDHSDALFLLAMYPATPGGLSEDSGSLEVAGQARKLSVESSAARIDG
jgi:ubiquinone/menaquinone biosynthesis C-methylase UbiE